MARRVLLVDDDETIVRLVRMYLERDGYDVTCAEDGESALALARELKPDIIILDLMLPKLSGLDVCRVLRAESRTPVLMLTARSTEADKLVGLDLGADDYLTKPFSPRELLARMRAVLRRVQGTDEADGGELRVGELVLFPRRLQAELRGEVLRLTPTEFNVLYSLAIQPGQVMTRGQIIERAFGHDFDGFERNVDVHVTSLRRKLGTDGSSMIRTVYGLGYRLDLPVASAID
jgi:DNA-binding response OmpR family regulator